MGTRNLTMVIKQGKTKVAQYGQWSGEPDGQGAKVLAFLQRCDLEELGEKANKLAFYTDSQIRKIEKDKDWQTKYPHTKREVAADILEFIYSGEVTQLVNSESFAADSLFCEWAYVIDLDQNTLEVYRGFQKKPLEKMERFYKFQGNIEGAGEKYYPIKMIKKYSLTDLPTKEVFIESLVEVGQHL